MPRPASSPWLLAVIGWNPEERVDQRAAWVNSCASCSEQHELFHLQSDPVFMCVWVRRHRQYQKQSKGQN